jgi:hypothetical protein
MTMMISEVYDPLVAAGSPDDKARRAAEALTKNDDRLAKLDGDMGLVKWMLGFNLATSVALLFLALRHCLGNHKRPVIGGASYGERQSRRRPPSRFLQPLHSLPQPHSSHVILATSAKAKL